MLSTSHISDPHHTALKKYAIPAVLSGKYTLEEAALQWKVKDKSILQKLFDDVINYFKEFAVPAVLNGASTVERFALQWNLNPDILEELVAEARSRMPSNPASTAAAQRQLDTIYVERKAVPSIVKAVHDLAYRQEKFTIRRDLLSLIKEELPGITVSALTLPGGEWLFERDILLEMPAGSTIVGLEANKDECDHTLKNVPVPGTGRCAFLHTTDQAYFSVHRGVIFNVIWLDYMGPFSKNRLNAYEDMLKNGFVNDDSVVALTFLKGRESEITQDVYKKYGKPKTSGSGKLTHLRKLAIPKEYRKISSKYGYEFTVLNMEEYKEDQGDQPTSPMFLLVFRLQRKNSRMNGGSVGKSPVKHPASTVSASGKSNKLAIVTDRDMVIFRILSDGPVSFPQIKSSIENVQQKKVSERVLRVRLAKLKNAGFVETKRCSSRNQIVTLYSLTHASISMLADNSSPNAVEATCVLPKTSLPETVNRKRSLIGAAECAASCAA